MKFVTKERITQLWEGIKTDLRAKADYSSSLTCYYDADNEQTVFTTIAQLQQSNSSQNSEESENNEETT